MPVPQFKSFFYRCFDGDNPLAGLSGHAYECSQMSVLYGLAQPFAAAAAKHLVCVDELGKGTEDTSATALCCAALEQFDAVRSSTSRCDARLLNTSVATPEQLLTPRPSPIHGSLTDR